MLLSTVNDHLNCHPPWAIQKLLLVKPVLGNLDEWIQDRGRWGWGARGWGSGATTSTVWLEPPPPHSPMLTPPIAYHPPPIHGGRVGWWLTPNYPPPPPISRRPPASLPGSYRVISRWVNSPRAPHLCSQAGYCFTWENDNRPPPPAALPPPPAFNTR